MTARRITGRAAAMATITVLFAGAAAAAAGGVLPGPFSGGTSEGVSTIGSVDPSSTGAATSEPLVTDPTSTDGSDTTYGTDGTDGTTEGTDGTDGTTEGTDGTDGTASSLPEAYGLCTAWNSGHEKKAENPAFAKLQHAADEMAGTVDEYCDQVFADKDASRHDGTDDATDSTDVDDDSDDDDSTDAPDSTEDHSAEHGSAGGSNGHGQGHGHGSKG